MLMTQVSAEENRKIQRITMSLPIQVMVCFETAQTWEETTYIKDVSSFGAGFFLSRQVCRGQLVCMSVSMPCKLRMYDLSEENYIIWGIVRRCVQIDAGKNEEPFYSVGVAFIGKFPPDSYNIDPLTTYEIVSRTENGFWIIEETSKKIEQYRKQLKKRRHTRYKIPTNVMVEILDDEGNEIAIEDTVTENISLGGAAIFCSYNVETGFFIRVISEQYNVSIISVIRGTHIGEDNIQRIHVEFIDRFFPLEEFV